MRIEETTKGDRAYTSEPNESVFPYISCDCFCGGYKKSRRHIPRARGVYYQLGKIRYTMENNEAIGVSKHDSDI